MDSDQRVELIAQRTQEVVSAEELKELFETKENPHAYIGFAPTGRVHVGYFIPLMKIADFLAAGCKFTFLIADLHAYLDDNKAPWDLLDARFEYYKEAISAVLEAIGAPLDQVNFVRGSDFEFQREYQENVLQMMGEVTLNRAKRAASEVVRFKEDPRLGGFVYPLLQIEDVYALDADIVLGGIDQRGIYMLGRDLASKMNRRKYACVFTPLLPGLTGAKMSASDETSKIDLLDDDKTVRSKLNKAYCPECEIDGNGVLAFAKHVIFPRLKVSGESFVIDRPEKFGGPLTFESYSDLESSFLDKSLHPLDLKNGVASVLLPLISSVRERINPHLVAKAYPQQ